jgi:hypothetical protein
VFNGARKGVHFGGAYFPQKWDLLPPFSHDTSSFKDTCFLIKLKQLPSGLCVSNGPPHMPVPTLLMPQTVEIGETRKSLFFRLFWLNIGSKTGSIPKIWLTFKIETDSTHGKMEEIESWIKTTSKLDNKIFLK